MSVAHSTWRPVRTLRQPSRLSTKLGLLYRPRHDYAHAESTEYGIRLNFVPVVLSAGRISLKIETDVSEPTYQGNYSTTGDSKSGTGGITHLGIRKREASTSVELPSGGSIMIAGLVQDNFMQAFSGYPGLQKIPVLGTLFRSKDFQRNETELVIIATPYLVRPVAREPARAPR